MNAEAHKNTQNKPKNVSETLNEANLTKTKTLSSTETFQAEALTSNENNSFLNKMSLENQEFLDQIQTKLESGTKSNQKFLVSSNYNINGFVKDEKENSDRKDYVINCFKANLDKNELGSQSKQKPLLEIKIGSPGNAAENSFKNRNNEEKDFVTEDLEINKKNYSKNSNQQLNENSKDAFKNDNKSTPKNTQNSRLSPNISSNSLNRAFIGSSKLSSFQANSSQNNLGLDKNENFPLNQIQSKSDQSLMHISSFEAGIKQHHHIPIEIQIQSKNQEEFSLGDSLLKQKNLTFLGSAAHQQKTNVTLQSIQNPTQQLTNNNYISNSNNNFNLNNNNNFNTNQFPTHQSEMLIEYQKASACEASRTPPFKNSFLNYNNNNNHFIPSIKMHPLMELREHPSAELLHANNDFIRKPLPINRISNMPPQIKAFPGAELYYKYASNISPEVLMHREKEEEKKKTHKCNCKKSRCLKLYCECFANGEYCIGCSCQDCANVLQNEKEKLEAFNYVRDKNPVAMKLINKVNKDLKQNSSSSSQNNLKAANLNFNSSNNNNYSDNYNNNFSAENVNNNINLNLKEKVNSFENEERRNSADYNNINNQINSVDRYSSSVNNLNNQDNWPIKSESNLNQAYVNNQNTLNPNSANISLNTKKSPTNKNFFEENNLGNQLENANNINRKQSNIYNPNLNLPNSNNANQQENIYINYYPSNNNNNNNNKNLKFLNNNNNNNNNTISNNIINEQIIGCNCTKSNCTKKYCECFKAGKTCIEACRCRECDNIDCIQRELKNKRKFKHRNAFPGSVYEDFVIEKISIHIEKSNIFIKESVIWDLREINKKDVNPSCKMIINSNNFNTLNFNNNAIRQDLSDNLRNSFKEKADFNSFNKNNNSSKILMLNEKGGNLISDFDLSLNTTNKQNDSIKVENNNNNNNQSLNFITEKNNKKDNFNANKDVNFEAIKNKNSFDCNEIYIPEKRSSFKNKTTQQDNNDNNKNHHDNKKIKNLYSENLNDKANNESENLKKSLIFTNNMKSEEANLSDISFENKTPSQNENNYKDEEEEESNQEASSFAESNDSKQKENLNCIEKKMSQIKSNKRKTKKIKFNLQSENIKKNENSSPRKNNREQNKNKIVNNNCDSEKIILPKNYKNFVSKNTFDTVSSFHNSVKNSKTKFDLRNELLYNNNINNLSSNNNYSLRSGLIHNANADEAKIEVLNNNNVNTVLLEKASIQKEEGLLSRKKARDTSN